MISFKALIQLIILFLRFWLEENTIQTIVADICLSFYLLLILWGAGGIAGHLEKYSRDKRLRSFAFTDSRTRHAVTAYTVKKG